MESKDLRWHTAGLAAVALTASMSLITPVQAYTYQPIKTFCAGGDCSDGGGPGPLVKSPSGAIYGTTEIDGTGGVSGNGTIFELVPGGGSYTFHSLYNFCSQTNCTDGNQPESALIADVNGNLYGMTFRGGAHNAGEVFEFSPATSTLTVLHSFCSKSGCADGSGPNGSGYRPTLTFAGSQTGALYDGTSSLYGNTAAGGNNGNGVVFRLTPSGGGWSFKVVHTFCTVVGCPDGQYPAYLGFDSKNHLIGTAGGGGTHSSGVLFRMNAKGDETVLYNFCSVGACSDGASPADFVLDAKGRIVGKALSGGDGANDGVIFRVTPKGNETVVYTFCQLPQCADGRYPGAANLFRSGSAFFGTAGGGGAYGDGDVYRLNGSILTVLYSFCPDQFSCDDGYNPGGLVMDNAGNLIGSTYGPGAGRIYELKK